MARCRFSSLVVPFLLAFTLSHGWCQQITDYTFTASAGTFVELPDTAYRAGDAEGNDGFSGLLPIGFTFVFNGVAYDGIHLGADGCLGFVGSSSSTNNLTSGGSRPLLAPLWDNLSGGLPTATALYQTEGTAGSRIFTIECRRWSLGAAGTVGTGNIDFQVKLHEADGSIEFHYRPIGIIFTTPSISIGIAGVATGAGNFLSLSDAGASPTVSSVTETSTIATFPVANQVYRFAPPTSVSAPSGLVVTPVSATSLLVTWSNNGINRVRNSVYVSEDGTYWDHVADTAASATSQSIAGLGNASLYHVKVVAFGTGSKAESTATGTTNAGLVAAGTYTVGPNVGDDYATLGAAFADIAANGLAGHVVLELQPGYLPGGETLPLVPPGVGGPNSSTTIRPAAGAGPFTFTSAASAVPVLDFDGSDYVIFDGRPGGTGSSRSLTFENTGTTNASGASTVRLRNDAHHNTLRYATVTMALAYFSSAAPLQIQTTTGLYGNDDNSIEQCVITGNGSGNPMRGILSTGTTTTEATRNDRTTIADCLLYDIFPYNSNASSMIELQAGNGAFTITGNRLYQTAERSYTGGHYVVNIQGGGMGDSVFSNNTIGYASDTATGEWVVGPTGTPGSTSFYPVYLATAGNIAVNGNVIAGMDIHTVSSSAFGNGAFTALYVQALQAEIGSGSPNIIGSATATPGIKLSIGNDCSLYIMTVNVTGFSTIANNTFAGITVDMSNAFAGTTLKVVNITSAGDFDITDNTIGSATVADSIRVGTLGLTNDVAGIRGIESQVRGDFLCEGNTIANLTTHSTGSGKISGIYTWGNTNRANTIDNLAAYVNGSSEVCEGVFLYGNGDVIGNSITRLIAQPPTVTSFTEVRGIYIQGSAGAGVRKVSGNLIHSFTNTSTTTGNDHEVGIEADSNSIIDNNMIRLGVAADGSVPTSARKGLKGIDMTFGEHEIYHNSIHLHGGGLTTGSATTFGIYSSSTDNLTVRNNIVVNARSNATGTGVHYGMLLNEAGAGIPEESHNIIHTPGVGGRAIHWDGTPYTTLSSYKIATGQGVGSSDLDPNFIAPAGDHTAVNLHIQSPTPAEGSGLAIVGYTTDFDGQARASLTPTDIGADAGNFVYVPVELSAFAIE